MGGEGDSPEEGPSEVVYMEEMEGKICESGAGQHAGRRDASRFRSAVIKCSDGRKWPYERRRAYQVWQVHS